MPHRNIPRVVDNRLVQISEYATRAKKHTVCETPAIKTLVMRYSKFIEYKVKMYNICNPFTILKF